MMHTLVAMEAIVAGGCFYAEFRQRVFPHKK
jgi:hypothetical protein